MSRIASGAGSGTIHALRSPRQRPLLEAAGFQAGLDLARGDPTRLNSLSLYGKYKWKKDRSVKVRYWIEKLDSTDWAVDNVEPNTLAVAGYRF